MSSKPVRTGVAISIRTRIIAAVILVAGAALTVSGVLVFILQQRALDARAVDSLRQSKVALQHLIEDGTNPETGGALTDPSEIVRLHLARTFRVLTRAKSDLSMACSTGCRPRSRVSTSRMTPSSWLTWHP